MIYGVFITFNVWNKLKYVSGEWIFLYFSYGNAEGNFDRVLSLSATNVDREILTHFVQV